MKSNSPKVFIPFLRRFTDERTHDLAQTIKLYNQVTSAHRASVWAHGSTVERVSNLIAEQVGTIVAVPDYLPICQALDTCQRAMLALETAIFSTPVVDFSK